MSFLSKRLAAICDLLKPDARVCDIGTDHAYLLIAALLKGKIAYGYALDIAEGPLLQAKANIHKHALEDKIKVIQSDGLASFTQVADSFVLAGMGAETIWEIIKNYDFNSESQIIIQSNTKHALLRDLLTKHGFRITKEIFFYDKSIPVFIFEIYKSDRALHLEPCDIYCGERRFYRKNQDYYRYIKKRYHHFDGIVKQNEDIKNELICLRKRLEGWDIHE